VVGAGTSRTAAVDSVGARVRLRAVASVDWLVCSPLAQATSKAAARDAMGTSSFGLMRYLFEGARQKYR
jgi:hypothetical protein